MRTFAEAAHPSRRHRPIHLGNHTEKSLVLPSASAIITEPAPDLDLHLHLHLALRYEVASWVLEDYTDREIMDHSPARKTTVTLGQLGDPRLALGSCGSDQRGHRRERAIRFRRRMGG